jgi:hypothetical protein
MQWAACLRSWAWLNQEFYWLEYSVAAKTTVLSLHLAALWLNDAIGSQPSLQTLLGDKPSHGGNSTLNSKPLSKAKATYVRFSITITIRHPMVSAYPHVDRCIAASC